VILDIIQSIARSGKNVDMKIDGPEDPCPLDYAAIARARGSSASASISSAVFTG